jgi:hypothetical protein
MAGKAVPLQAWSGPEFSRKLRFPDFMTTAQDCGKVVSLTHRPPLPQEIHLVLISVKRLSRPQGHSATGRVMSLKNSNDTFGNWLSNNKTNFRFGTRRRCATSFALGLLYPAIEVLNGPKILFLHTKLWKYFTLWSPSAPRSSSRRLEDLGLIRA